MRMDIASKTTCHAKAAMDAPGGLPIRLELPTTPRSLAQGWYM